MAAIPSVSKLYGGDPMLTDGVPTPSNSVGTPKPAKLAARHEQYQKSIAAAINEGARGDVIEIGREEGVPVPFVRSKRVHQKELARGYDQSGLQKGHREIVAEHMEYLQKSGGMLSKEWQLNNPIPTGLVPYDLESPSKLIWPRPTPLVNAIPRVRAQGMVRRLKIINAVSNSGTGVATINPGISETGTVTTPSGQVLVRGPAIGYEGFDYAVNQCIFSLSDYVTWASEFEGLGFDDVRQLSATSLLYSAKLAEERMYLYSRGTTAGGFVGPLGTPGSVTLAAVSASIAPVGPTTNTTTLSSPSYVIVAADAGDLQTPSGSLHQGPSTVAGTHVASVSVTTGQAIQVTIGTDVTGALGYNLYVASAAAGPFVYAGRTGYNVGYITAQPISGPTTTSGAADASALSTNYDGLLTNTAASGGYSTRLNAPFSTTNPGTEFQTAFASLYEQVKGDPEEVWLNGFDRLQLSNAIVNNAANSAYRVFIGNDTSSMGNVAVGTVVTTLLNEVTGSAVDLNVHPWMPQSNALVRQRVLPWPMSNISETTYLATVQDSMGSAA